MPVLVYHAVGEEKARPYSVNIDAFREQLRIVGQEFDFVHLRDFPSRFGQVGRPSVAITFDDGFLNIREVVHPILEELGVPYTVFVPSGYLGALAGPWAPHPLPVMTPEDLRALSASELVDIGSHSVSHADLGVLSASEVERELSDSKSQLEAVLRGYPVKLFSFPFGQKENLPGPLEEPLRKAGYHLAVTTRFGAMNSRHNVLRLNRIALGEEEGPRVWMEKLRGLRDWLALKEEGGYLLRKLGRSLHSRQA